MTRTVRFRLTAIATLTVAVVLVAASGLIITIQQRVLTDSIDDSLRDHIAQLAAALEADGIPPVLEPAGDDIISQVVLRDGTVRGSTSNLTAASALVVFDREAGTSPRLATLGTVGSDVSEGHDYRIATVRIATPESASGNEAVLMVGLPLDDIADSVAALVTSLLVVIPMVVIGLGVLIWFLVGRALRPVERIRAEVASIGGADLHRRVPVPSGDDEIARLATTMNSMLGRLHESARRQHEFVADASHELRTPLTRIRSELEVDRAHPETADLVATHASVLDETIALQTLVDDLLLLATGAETKSNGSPPVAHAPADLAGMVLDEVRAGERHGLVIDVERVVSVSAVISEDDCRRVVRNVLDNAVRHARSTITVELTDLDERALLCITDDGPGIDPDDRERIFERFVRVDESRSSSEGGAGLGLAIARAIVERWGGNITVGDTPHGARFLIEFVRASSPDVQG